MNDDLKKHIELLAQEALIDEVRYIDAEDLEPKELFQGRQPRDLLPKAKSIILFSVYIGAFHFEDWAPETYAKTSRLALSGFYFNVAEPLKPIKEFLISRGLQAVICDGSQETNCIPLKNAAVKAGLGWIGKNTLLINRKYGSWQALGAILTDTDLSEEYLLEKNLCGTCTACISACPLHGLNKPGQLDRSGCLSSLLEEDDVPEEVQYIKQNYVLECDICQEKCPWNKTHIHNPMDTPMGRTFTNKTELLELFKYEELLKMSESDYLTKMVPNLSGFSLPYEIIRRNLKLAYTMSKND